MTWPLKIRPICKSHYGRIRSDTRLLLLHFRMETGAAIFFKTFILQWQVIANLAGRWNGWRRACFNSYYIRMSRINVMVSLTIGFNVNTTVKSECHGWSTRAACLSQSKFNILVTQIHHGNFGRFMNEIIMVNAWDFVLVMICFLICVLSFFNF